MDEVHERSVDADILSLIVKQLFHDSGFESQTRLVLMSATFNSEVFGKYFTPTGMPIPPPVFVGVHRFPCETYYLESILDCEVNNTCFRIPSALPHILHAHTHSMLTFHQADLIIFQAIEKHKSQVPFPFTSMSLVELGRKVSAAKQDPSRAPSERLESLIVSMCGAIAHHHKGDKEGNCVVVFLPGILDIESLSEAFRVILGGGLALVMVMVGEC